MPEIKEQKWLCGCHVVDGVLALECTQQKPQGEVNAAQHAASRPYSAKCFRLAQSQAQSNVVHVPVPAGDTNIEVAALHNSATDEPLATE